MWGGDCRKQLLTWPVNGGGFMSKGKTSNLARLARGTYGSGGEILDKTLYDTAVLAAATTVHRLFTIPLGQAGKTLDRTNMTTGGMMPQGQNIAVRAIKVFYTSLNALATADVQTLYTFLRTCTAEIILPGKDSMGEWTLQELMGSALMVASTPTAAGDNIPVISPRFHGIMPLNTPLVLAALTPFEVRLTCHTASGAALDGDFIGIGLTGTMQRAS